MSKLNLYNCQINVYNIRNSSRPLLKLEIAKKVGQNLLSFEVIQISSREYTYPKMSVFKYDIRGFKVDTFKNYLQRCPSVYCIYISLLDNILIILTFIDFILCILYHVYSLYLEKYLCLICNFSIISILLYFNTSNYENNYFT